MLRFSFLQREGTPLAIDLTHAYLMGIGDQSVAGAIKLVNGVIECDPPKSRAAALTLECETAEMGRLAISTCLLEQREEPYSLVLELVRNRIKQFIAKCEDWQIWDHPAASDALAQWNEARSHFTAAMTTQDSAQADALSYRALIAGLKASERLAVAHAQILMHRRFGKKAASTLVLGVRVETRVKPTAVAGALGAFDMINIPLRWSEIEKTPGQFDFSTVAEWIDWASTSGRTVLAGPIVDLRPGAMPAWIEAKRGDFSVLRDGVWKFAQAAGKALAGRVGMWDVAAGLNDNSWWGLSVEEMVEIARRSTVGVRQARKDVPTLLEIVNPFGQDVASNPGALTPRTLVDALGNDGIHLDCLLLQLVMGEAVSGRVARDLLQVSALLDSYIPFRKPVFLEIGAPSAPVDSGSGYWRAPWSEKSQAIWASRIFSIAMSKPHIEMVLWHRLADDEATRPAYGVIDRAKKVKLALPTLLGVRKALRTPIGPWHAPAVAHSKESKGS